MRMHADRSLALVLVLSNVITSRQNPANDPGLIAWVEFGKTASTYLERGLTRRAQRHGWPKACHAVWPRLHRTKTNVRPACSHLPAGYVVQADMPFCELLQAARLARPCRYMTLLRDPIARVVSEFDHFCLSCKEGQRGCELNRTRRGEFAHLNRQLPRDELGVPAERPHNTCPEMGLVDFAVMTGNKYVTLFGREVREFPRSSQGSCEEARAAASPFKLCPPLNLTADDLVVAGASLAHPNMLVIFTEQLHLTATHQALGRFLNDSVDDVLTSQYTNRHDKKAFEPTVRQVLALQRALQWDIALFSTQLWAAAREVKS